MERIARLELASSVWKTEVIPIYDIRMDGKDRRYAATNTPMSAVPFTLFPEVATPRLELDYLGLQSSAYPYMLCRQC